MQHLWAGAACQGGRTGVVGGGGALGGAVVKRAACVRQWRVLAGGLVHVAPGHRVVAARVGAGAVVGEALLGALGRVRPLRQAPAACARAAALCHVILPVIAHMLLWRQRVVTGCECRASCTTDRAARVCQTAAD